MTDPSGEFNFDFQHKPHAAHPSDEETTILNQSQQQAWSTGATQAFTPGGNPTTAPAEGSGDLGETQAMPPLWEFEEGFAPGAQTAAPTQAVPQPMQPVQATQPTQAMSQATQPIQTAQQPTQAFPAMPTNQTAPAASSQTLASQTQATQAMPTMPSVQETQAMPSLQATQAMPRSVQGTPAGTMFGDQSGQSTQVFNPETMQPRVAGQATPRTISTPVQPTILPPSIPPEDEQDDDGKNESDSGKGSKKLSKGKIAGIVIAVIAVIALIAGGVTFFRSNSGKLAYAACTSAQSSYNNAIKKLNAEVAKAQQNAPAAGTVDNQQTLTDLNQAISNASSVTTKASCSADMKKAELKSNTTSFKNAVKQAKEARTAIEDALDAANGSKDDKDISALKSDLNANISNAQTVLNNSAGKVADESTRTALQNAISNANNVAGQSKPAQSDVNNAKSRLQKATSDVNASISAKQQADADAQRRQQEQQNANNQNQSQNQNSTTNGQTDQNQNTQCDGSTDGSCQSDDSGN